LRHQLLRRSRRGRLHPDTRWAGRRRQITSSNNTGDLELIGGPGNDIITLESGSHAGNVLQGDAGNDTLVDEGGGWDYLTGGNDNDCLSAACFLEMDCGPNTDTYWWAGASVCCSGEFCEYPTNCENTTSEGCN
jgi:hypothetical protein